MTQTKTTQIKALLAKIDLELDLTLQEAEDEQILELEEEILLFQKKLEKVNNKAELVRNKYAETVAIGQEFSIGLRRYKKTEAKGRSKLDVKALEAVLHDADALAQCFEQKPKNQKEVAAILASQGISIDVKQLYKAEIKDGFKVKQLN
jgi:hypothetical protein